MQVNVLHGRSLHKMMAAILPNLRCLFTETRAIGKKEAQGKMQTFMVKYEGCMTIRYRVAAFQSFSKIRESVAKAYIVYNTVDKQITLRFWPTMAKYLLK